MAGRQAEVKASSLSGEDVFALLGELQRAGFAIGIDEYIAAQELTEAWRSRGGGDRQQLRNWLAPALCISPEQQTEFYRRYRDWWTAHIQASPADDERRPSDAARFDSLDLAANMEKSRPSKWMALQVALLAAVGLGIWYLYSGDGVPEPSRIESVPVETVDSVEDVTDEARLDPLLLYVSGTVVDPQGNGIPGATLSVVGSDPGDGATRVLDEATTGIGGQAQVSVDPGEFADYLDVRHPDYSPPEHFRLPEGTGHLTLRAEMVPGSAWSNWWRRHQEKVALALTLLPLILAGCWWGWKRTRRKLILERRISRRELEGMSIWLPEPRRGLYRGETCVRARIEARRYRAFGSGDLDEDATVERTVNRLGCFFPVYRSRLELPSYLVLIDRTGFRDQQARLVDTFLDRLAEGGLPIVRYYFDRDPRLCATSKTDENQQNLKELASVHEGHRLLLFSDGAGVMNPVTGRLAAWTELFSSWRERALMTPISAGHWSSREVELASSGFRVLPATPTGLLLFSESLRTPNAPLFPAVQTEEERPTFPEILIERPVFSLDRSEPSVEEVEELVRQVRVYLGKDNFRWLCSLAVYPELEWYMTLYLGLRLRRADGSALLDEGELLTLTRLPWLRVGFMPDWLRARLISELSKDDEHAVRSFLQELLMCRFESPESPFRLEVVRPCDARDQRGSKRFFVDLLRTEPVGSELHDYVFVTFVLGRKPDRLQLAAPQNWRQWVYDRGLRPLGLRTVPVLVLAVIFSSAGLFIGPLTAGLGELQPVDSGSQISEVRFEASSEEPSAKTVPPSAPPPPPGLPDRDSTKTQTPVIASLPTSTTTAPTRVREKPTTKAPAQTTGVDPKAGGEITTGGPGTEDPVLDPGDVEEVKGGTVGGLPDAPAPPTKQTPLRVGGSIKAPNKIGNVNPIYPPHAKEARIQGIVILEAIIDQQGNVTNVRVLRSIPALDRAAIDAVKQWKYEPTLLNGVPVPIVMTVTVNFALR